MSAEQPQFEIILFYKYVHIENPTALMRAQKRLQDSLGLKGRTLIATEGINATIEGTTENINAYILNEALGVARLLQNVLCGSSRRLLRSGSVHAT